MQNYSIQTLIYELVIPHSKIQEAISEIDLVLPFVIIEYTRDILLYIPSKNIANTLEIINSIIRYNETRFLKLIKIEYKYYFKHLKYITNSLPNINPYFKTESNIVILNNNSLKRTIENWFKGRDTKVEEINSIYNYLSSTFTQPKLHTFSIGNTLVYNKLLLRKVSSKEHSLLNIKKELINLSNNEIILIEVSSLSKIKTPVMIKIHSNNEFTLIPLNVKDSYE